MTREDLPMLYAWLCRRHVAQWFDGAPDSLETVIDTYGPAIDGDIPQWCYIALIDGAPIGFIQAYSPAGWHAAGWWLEVTDPNVRGVDQFLANEDQLNQGIGTAMTSAFVDMLFADPAVSYIQTDPEPDNLRAIRCYEKSGFRIVGRIDTPAGPSVLMHRERT